MGVHLMKWLPAALLAPLLLLAMHVASVETVEAGHADGNIKYTVNYRAVENGVVNVCDTSTETTAANLAGALQAWDGNAQRNIAEAGCSSVGVNVIDVPDLHCGALSNACASYPDQESPPTTTIWMEDDADGVVEDAYIWDVEYSRTHRFPGIQRARRSKTRLITTGGTVARLDYLRMDSLPAG